MSTAKAIRFAMPKPVARKVARLRRLMRLYVLLEGLAALLLLFGVAFWAGLAVDWLFEPSPGVRIAMWGCLLATGSFVVVHYILRRFFARLPQVSIALALERRFPQLRESLVTTVEASRRLARQTGISPADRFHPAMLRETSRIAAEEIARAPVSRVLQAGPLVWKAVAAVALGLSVTGFALVGRADFDFWLERMKLSEQPWPRRAQLQVLDFVEHDGIRVVNVARDDDYDLHVLASIRDGHAAPSVVEIRYRLADGRRGRDTMTKVGEALPGRDDAQRYRYQFKHVVADLDFEIVGDDDRIRNLRLRTVERPQIMRVFVDFQYPSYLQRAPRSAEIGSRLELPEGANATCLVRTNKPLRQVRIDSTVDKADLPASIDANNAKQFQFTMDDVIEDRVLMITMNDEDGVENREPYRLLVSVVHDQVPEVSVQMRGIGSAITPQASIPFEGRISDEYGLEAVWFEFRADQQQPERRDMQQSPGGYREFRTLDRFDLAEIDPETKRPRTALKPGQKFAISVQASDAYNLTDAPHVGVSQRFLLDVVTPSELRAILEKRELGLRQRFEAIYEKMAASRDLLDRIGAITPQPTNEETGEENRSERSEKHARNRDRNRLRVTGILQNVTQAAYETLGVADGFDDIVDELVNNRVDTEELKKRLNQEIAEPLRAIGREQMPQFERRLQAVQSAVGKETALRQPLLAARKEGDAVLAAMKAVLDRMLELESYNELVELLRGIVTEQEQLSEETKKQQRARLRDLLDDL